MCARPATAKNFDHHRSLLWGLLWSIVLLMPVAHAGADVPAFPGAEGFGAQAVGGRGGTVYVVTNLNDSGTGSLRACVEASGPRTCVFRTGGTIVLEAPLIIRNPYITIAGQTAPGGGITLRNNDNPKAPIEIWTHEVIIRYLRSRPGPFPEGNQNSRGLTIANNNPDVKPHNIIIDHCSFSWSTEELIIIWYDAHDITYQWNVFSEGLMCSTHNKVLNEPERCDGSFRPVYGHSYGPLVGGEISGPGTGPKNITFHHNLFAHNGARNPQIKASGIAEVVNNVMYNPIWSGSQTSDKHAVSRINYVGNYFKPGPNTQSGQYMISAKEDTGYGLEVYLEGNIGPHRPSNNLDELLVVKPRSYPVQTSNRHPAPSITTHGCDSLNNCQAYDVVLDQAGAKHGVASDGAYFARRDAVDKRIVAEVQTGTGRIIDAPSQEHCYGPYCERYVTANDYTRQGISDPLGADGWPVLEAGMPPADSDRDGMPDVWEQTYGFDPNDVSDGAQDADDDVYTNLEEFLNGTNPRPEGWSPPGDTTPPVISNVQAASITENSATILWETDELADSNVTYGFESTFTDSATTEGLQTTHRVTLNDLLSSTTYHYQVSSTDEAGNTAMSPNLTFSTTEPDPSPSTILDIRVSSSRDDAEETRSGRVQRTSTDLDLGDHLVGIRFQDVNIPQGVTIKQAYIQFTVDARNSAPTNLSIYGEAKDHTSRFSGSRRNISSRATTTMSVSWQPPAWGTVGVAGLGQRTPSLAAIVQEIVDRPGWKPGNSLSFIITGSGYRQAESYNGVKASAPVLHVEY